MRIWIALVVLLVFGVAGCSDGDSPAATSTVVPATPSARATEVPRSTPQPTATPQPPEPVIQQEAGWGDVLGPVLVYKEGIGADLITAFDFGMKRPVWTVPAIDDGFVVVGGVAVTERGVVLATRNSLYSLGTDGLPERRLIDLEPGWQGFSEMAVSQDGSMIAVSIVLAPEPHGTPGPGGSQGVRWKGAVLFYDLETEKTISVVEGSGDVLLAEGPLVWRDDGTGVVLLSYTNSERPPPVTTVLIDGRTIPHGVDGYAQVAPNGRTAMRGLGSVGCLAPADHQMLFEDLISGSRIAEVHNDQRLFTGLAWSPDSSEYLFISRQFVAEQVCNIHSLPITYLLLNIPTGQISTVSDLKSLFQRWYGGKFFWMECETGFVGFSSGEHGVTNGYCPEKPGGIRAPITLSYDGISIDKGDGFQTLGVIP